MTKNDLKITKDNWSFLVDEILISMGNKDSEKIKELAKYWLVSDDEETKKGQAEEERLRNMLKSAKPDNMSAYEWDEIIGDYTYEITGTAVLLGAALNEVLYH